MKSSQAENPPFNSLKRNLTELKTLIRVFNILFYFVLEQ